MKIKTKLRIVAILPVGFFLIVGLVLFLTSQQVNKVKEQADISDALIKDMFELDLLLHEYLLYHGERSQTQWQLKHDSIGKILTAVEFKDTEGQSFLEDIRRDFQEIKVLFSRLIATAGIAASAELHDRLVGQILIKTRTMVSDTKQLSVLSHAKVITIQRRADLLIIVLLVILSVVMVVALFLIGDGVARHISKLHEGAEIIGSGNLDYKVGIDTKDEIGQLSRVFDKMTGELKETYTSLEQEIGERKHAEKDLQRLNRELEQHIKQLDAANKELEDFSYTVSHDLKSPLRAIDGFSNILLEDYSRLLDDEGKRLLNIIRNNERRMAQLIDNILSFLHFRSMEPKMVDINMEELAQEVWKEIEPLTAGRNVQFEVKAMPNAIGDRAMIWQVFANLISNAVKFTRGRELAVIEIGTTNEGRMTHDEVIYYIKDNGVGFDMQYANKLFGVFLRLHHADEFEGNAIGLAIVRRIIEKHGSRVWAEGKVGEGAAFYLSLPKAENRV